MMLHLSSPLYGREIKWWRLECVSSPPSSRGKQKAEFTQPSPPLLPQLSGRLFSTLLGFRLLLVDGWSFSSAALFALRIGLAVECCRGLIPRGGPQICSQQRFLVPGAKKGAGAKVFGTQIKFEMMVSSPINLTSFAGGIGRLNWNQR